MRIGILKATRTLPDLISYIPKAGCGKRQFKLFRSGTKMGASKVKPLVMCDPDFWTEQDYPEIIEAIVAAASRDWKAAQTAGDKSNSKGVAKAKWTAIRGKAYESVEMIGAMLVRMSYDDAKDYVVSAAPNLLYNTGAKTYAVHPNKGDNQGTQIHSEMIMGEQLLALVAAMKGATELPLGQKVARKGLSAGDLSIDVDLFIEKAAMCGGCEGTWNDHLKGVDYRLA